MLFDDDDYPRAGFADFVGDAITLLSMCAVSGAVIVGFWWLVPQVMDWFK